MISDHEIGETLKWGAELIQKGGDHFDLHTSTEQVQQLQQRLPTLVNTIRQLLYTTYHVQPPPSSSQTTTNTNTNTTKQQWLQPVAFRISAVGPLDGRDVVPLHGSLSHTSNYLIRILNRQVRYNYREKQRTRPC